jgi:hypothetical protein
MIGKFARAAIAALVLGSTALGVGALPAQAQTHVQARPGMLPNNEERETYYYSSAAKTTVVGYSEWGNCGVYNYGTSSIYTTTVYFSCS